MSAHSPAVRRRMTRVDRSAQLLDVAEELIGRQGVGATSMDAVAEAAGVTKPIVYDHFGSKDGLLCALIRRAGDELYARTVDAVAAAEGPREALELGLRTYFEALDSRQGMWWTLLDATAAVSPATVAELEAIRRRQAAFMAELITAELPAEAGSQDALIYANTVVGACERLAVLRLEQRRLSVDTVTARLLDVLWGGFDSLRRPVRPAAAARSRSPRIAPPGAARR